MSLTKEQVANLVKDYGKTATDTGSPQVQIALLTEQIKELTEHLKGHANDHHGRRGLLVLVGRRGRLLRFLEKSNRDAYLTLIDKLGLRK
ncbi:MAG: 30S ribosomal protein S15 [Bacilli bacterium]